MTQDTRSKSYEQQQQESVAARVVSRRRRRLMNNLLINLPEDVLIYNILLKVPMKSLLNLRYVCSSLRSLITSPAFVNMHLHHSTITLNKKELVLISPPYSSLDLDRDPLEKPPPNPLEKPPPNMFHSLNFNATDDPSCPERAEVTTPFRSPRIFGSCNGLLCLSEKDSFPNRNQLQTQTSTYSSPCIWNPATKEYKELPTPTVQNPFGDHVQRSAFQPRLIHYGFGYDSTTNDYKVIRCETFTSMAARESITEFQVYSLETNAWRNISTPYRSYSLAHKRQGLFVNGAFHWIMSLWRGSVIEASIISLDIQKEKFRELQKPHNKLIVDMRTSTWELQVLGGCLCIHEEVYLKTEKKVDVWMMNDYGVKDSWTKLFAVVDPLADPCWYKPMGFKLLNLFENGEILILMNSIPLIIYDPVKDRARCVDNLLYGYYYEYMGIYIESLVSLKSGTYRGREQVSKEFKMEQTEKNKNKNNKKRKILPEN